MLYIGNVLFLDIPIVSVVLFAIALIIMVIFNKIMGVEIVFYTALSILTFVAFGVDKYKAKYNKLRVPESTLHIYSLFGGWPGALVGQRLFRHKTLKQPFKKRLHISIFLNLMCLAGYLIFLHV